jgi:hypothetical protein
MGQRVISAIQVPVDSIVVSHRVGLHKSTDMWIITSNSQKGKSSPTGAGSTDFDIESAAGEHVGIGKEVG